MAEPITLSLAGIAVAKFCGDVVLHVGYHEGHHFYREFVERWQDSPIDLATGLPRNHDLQEASRKALREAAQVLVMELAGQLEPSKPWIPRLVQHVREGKLGKVPLIEAGRDPQREWVEALRKAIAGPAKYCQGWGDTERLRLRWWKASARYNRSSRDFRRLSGPSWPRSSAST